MKIRICCFIFFCIASNLSYGQGNVGIGVSTPNKNAVLELVSAGNNQGILVPKLTTVQRTAAAFTSQLSAVENGLLVFDSDDKKFYFWQTNQWLVLGSDISGPASGDLSGTYPAPAINANAVTSAKILDGTITAADLSNLSIDDSKIASGITVSKLLPGTNGQVLTTTAGAVGWATNSVSGTAGGDLSGTYPNPAIVANAVTSAKILDGTIATADLANLSVNDSKIATGVAVAKLVPGTNGQVLTTTAGVPAWGTAGSVTSVATGTGLTGGPITTTGTVSLANTAVIAGTYGSATAVPQIIVDAQGRITSAIATTINGVVPGGAAGGDLAGTYPAPTINANAVTSAKILDGTIIDADLSPTAAIATTKIAPGAAGQVLTTSGGIPQWANPSGSVLINNAGVRNLFAGLLVGGTGTDNAFFGSSAGNANASGNFNVIFGANAGDSKTVGDLNTLIGWIAGRGIGATAAFNGNTFVGAQSGQNSTGGPNTFIGEKSGQANTTGTQNLFAGNRAGLVNTTGTQNTILGYFADVSTANLQNGIAIGFQTVVDASNKVRLGNTAITVIEGQVPFTSASDRRFKTAIASLGTGLDFIMKLNPVSYQMKNTGESKINWGFIAQEVEALVGNNNSIVSVGADKDKTLGLRYTDFVAPLVKAVQEQQTELDALRASLQKKEQQIKALEEAVSNLKSESSELASIKDQLEKIKKSLGL